MSDVSMRQMLEAGVHFGHQTRFWHPKMAPYIFGERNKIHIINLERSLPLFEEAINFIGRLAAKRGKILLVGTKRAAQEAIAREAQRCSMPYVRSRPSTGFRAGPEMIESCSCDASAGPWSFHRPKRLRRGSS